MSGARRRWLFVAGLTLSACVGADEDDFATSEGNTDDAVTVNTATAEARAQYDANVRFATQYVPRCTVRAGGRPRALVTGFGRFLDNPENATGRVVSALVPGVRYPVTARPAPGEVDSPAAQMVAGVSTVRLPTVGEVDVCAVILPVSWDLSAILALKEIDSFRPSVVVMNGIAGPRQPLWLELGSVNRAMTLRDGSDLLVPEAPAGQRFAAIVPSAVTTDLRRGMLLSWARVATSMRSAIEAQGAVSVDGERFDDVVEGVSFGGYPRDSNTYLCNNLTYVVNYAMAYPGRVMTLLQASTPRAGAVNRVAVRLRNDFRTVPRVFVHWPSTLHGAHLGSGATVLKSLLDAQLSALRDRRELPTLGDNANADLLPSGDTF